MEKTFYLQEHFYWTRERAIPIRAEILELMEQLAEGDVLLLDVHYVQAFDYSFAAELFERLIKTIRSRDGRFLLIDGLTEYNRENLQTALESLNLCTIARSDGNVGLVGQFKSVDAETFDLIAKHRKPSSASELQASLGISLNAVNERLKKLLGLGLIRRIPARSASGREQFLYRTLS